MKRALGSAALIFCASVALAADLPKTDVAKGQAIATQVCAACHGVEGNSPAPVNPKLAGQIPEYLHRQLMDFKPTNGKAARPSPVMSGFAAPLSPEDMRNVAAYYASQQPKPGAARNKETIALGRQLWRGGDVKRGLPACASCHGATGEGIPVQYPRLAGQHAEYTEAQLKAFRAGERANDAAQVMRDIAARMTDLDIRAVADYAAGLK